VSDASLPVALRDFRHDAHCKAVVLRVNSPGGSALASDVIQRELRLTAKEKPLIVSMGSYAASGGYWISAYGHRIFADPLTITGSIGVFGMIPNVQDIANEHGITFDRLSTSEFGDLYTISKPKSELQINRIQSLVESIYQDFLRRVAQGRDLPMDHVQTIAEGRVWCGSAALEHQLIDELGGLSSALAYAREQGELAESAPIVEYPKRRNMEELFAELFGEPQQNQPLIRTPSIMDNPMLQTFDPIIRLGESLNDPRQTYARMPWIIEIE